jgi:organic hydroperoxide reductase OsmC/OhrA
MSEHHARIAWTKETESFAYNDYNREHDWTFVGGQSLRASATSRFLGKDEFVDPEEAFVASLSACHMLTFLALAARKRITVEAYADEAVGYLEFNDRKKLVITRVVLRPTIRFAHGQEPTPDALTKLHDQSHQECFLANSVTTEITVEAPR